MGNDVLEPPAMPEVTTGKQPVKDLPRAEIVKLADSAIAHGKGRTQVYYKFTCAHCGQRLTLVEPDVLPEVGECFRCGKETLIEEAGFMLMLTMPPKKEIA